MVSAVKYLQRVHESCASLAVKADDCTHRDGRGRQRACWQSSIAAFRHKYAAIVEMPDDRTLAIFAVTLFLFTGLCGFEL